MYSAPCTSPAESQKPPGGRSHGASKELIKGPVRDWNASFVSGGPTERVVDPYCGGAVQAAEQQMPLHQLKNQLLETPAQLTKVQSLQAAPALQKRHSAAQQVLPQSWCPRTRYHCQIKDRRH